MRMLGSLIVVVCLAMAGTLTSAGESPEAAVVGVLDDFHAAASDADEKRYLDHFAPDGVFGPDTMDDLARVTEPWEEIAEVIIRERFDFLVRLAGRRGQIKFLRGWARRVLDLWEEAEKPA